MKIIEIAGTDVGACDNESELNAMVAAGLLHRGTSAIGMRWSVRIRIWHDVRG
jgi:hypothetical protein